MSSESIKDKVSNVLNELIIAVATETRNEVIADFNERLQKTFGGGFKIETETTSDSNGHNGSVTHVTEPVKSRSVRASKKVTAPKEKPKKKRKMTPAFRAAMERNLAKARAQRAKNIRAEKRGLKKKTKKK
jgi:hypothetical protein